MRSSLSGKWVLMMTLLTGLLFAAATVGAMAIGPAAQDAPASTMTPVADVPDINNADMPQLETGRPAGDLPIAKESDLEVNSVDFQSAPNAPKITVWYKDSYEFGKNGDPQKWVNILGNVSGVNYPIVSLSYTLNGVFGSSLSRGPDDRRLAAAGDFLIEIDYTDLLPGDNQVVIYATDTNNETTEATVTFKYTQAPAWTPGTYVTSWQNLSAISEKAQVVTGLWALDNGTVRPTIFDYDRLIALGDLSWKDYTVTVPITVHGIDDNGFGAPSFGPGVGLIVRWQGHFDNGTQSQPNLGWRRLGALGWYHWSKPSGVPVSGFQFFGHTGIDLGQDNRPLVIDKTYNFKVKVKSNADPSKPSTYSFKVWDSALTEPAAWDFESVGHSNETKSGSIVLLAHHVDATFGTVTVKLDSVASPPKLTTGTSGTGTGTLAVVPNKTTFRFGEDAALTATAGAGSTFTGWTGNVSGDEVVNNKAMVEMFSSRTIGAVFTDPSIVTPTSDDFSACALDEDLWTYINPLKDTTLTMTGTQLKLDVPSGAHDYWTSTATAPRIMQYIEDKDFSIEVKFDSELSQKTQIQGVIIEEDADNWLRYSIQHDGSSYKLVAHTSSSGQTTKRYSADIVVTAPSYLQVQRAGDSWTLRYSDNGQTWTTAATYSHVINPNSAGVFAGNVNSAPATTVLVDYFFNTASPIVPEDGGGSSYTLSVEKQGTGTVGISPLKSTYACGEQVTLTATPETGWKFLEWQGGATGTDPVKIVTMNKNLVITAVFVPDQQYTLSLTANGLGAISKEPNKTTFSAGEMVKLTALPDLGYMFTGWTGDVVSLTSPITVAMDSNKSITGSFAVAPNRTLVASVPGGGGSIQINPDQQEYLNGSVVSLTAQPLPGFSFVEWGGDLTGETANPAQLLMNADKTVTAVFAENVHTLTVVENPDAGGNVTRDPNKPLYYDGEEVELTATPAPGYIFLNWVGVANSTDNPLSLTMTGDKTVTANFVTVGEFTLNAAVNGPGQVSKNPDIPSYPFGEPVTLTATADAGYAFIGWSGDLTGTANPGVLTMTENSVVTATYTQDNLYSLTVTPIGPGEVSRIPDRLTYAQDQEVVLTAEPDPGYRFTGWGGDLTGTNNPATIKMTKNTVITATFEEAVPVDLLITVAPIDSGTVTVNPQKTEYLTGDVITLTAKAAAGYTFSGWQGDAIGNSKLYELVLDTDKSVVATFTDEPQAVSDDFNSCSIDPVLWQWVDPTGLADYEMTGTQVRMVIPPGANYNIGAGGNYTARLMQSIPNTDFTLETKIESMVSLQYQYQGLLFEEDADNYIYFQLFYNGSEVKAYGGSVVDGVASSRFSETVTPSGDTYLRVSRGGDDWRLDYSEDGTNWELAGRRIKHVINVNSAGIFAGSHSRNSGSQPGYVALFDFFFDFSNPISPEDAAPPTIITNVTGPGSLTLDPDKPVYTCGEEVMLTAEPSANAQFLGWGGDLSGNDEVEFLTVTGVHNVTAAFATGTYKLFLPIGLR